MGDCYDWHGLALHLVEPLLSLLTLTVGFVKTWWELVICRALLGVLEAGFFPACTYIISTWYVRREIQKRMTGFYVLSIMISGFSSAIAGGISEMAGIADLGGWQWIFVSILSRAQVSQG